jgi:N-carbamoylputrescine amidase
MKVAAVQFEPIIGEAGKNLARSCELLDEAVQQGSELVVLPELATSGYLFASRDEAFELAEAVPGGPSSLAWAEFARANGVYVVGGVTERAGDVLHNSAAFFGPKGFAGVYRKAHLWSDENVFFVPGVAPSPIFDTPRGRIGVAICYDAWFPEVFRSLGLRGTDIVCVPFNNEIIPSSEVPGPEMAMLLCRSAGHVNGFSVVAANRTGVERGLRFGGQSFIAGASGGLLAGPAPDDGTSILVADVEVEQQRRSLSWTPFNHPLRDRRPALYEPH